MAGGRFLLLEKFFMVKTKIIATVGPSSEDKKILASLIRNGADVLRINFSHAS